MYSSDRLLSSLYIQVFSFGDAVLYRVQPLHVFSSSSEHVTDTTTPGRASGDLHRRGKQTAVYSVFLHRCELVEICFARGFLSCGRLVMVL